MGNDFKTAPRSTFDIVYEKSGRFVLFQPKEGQHTVEAVTDRKQTENRQKTDRILITEK